ncbi:MAG: hypothetical protein A3K18_12780 [Lentisphaerae bacterium RIFOXYA12_64_32]|nr:MAG: hypothetical protein A3K18_12780 [Lentisphaerae bacterium RIFOXYA12_64_32]
MTTKRIVGIVLLMVGVAVLLLGLNVSHSVVDRVSSSLTGGFTEATTWYIIGGATWGLMGLLLVFFGGGCNRDLDWQWHAIDSADCRSVGVNQTKESKER